MMCRVTLLACAIAASAFGSGAATCGGPHEPCGDYYCNGDYCRDGLECNSAHECVPCLDKFEHCNEHDNCCGDSECHGGQCLPTVCIPPGGPPPVVPPPVVTPPVVPPPVTPPPFPVCPRGNRGKGTVKFCIEDLQNAKPGQATCGTPTCNALCEFVCGRPGDYTPDMCNNSGGGNCKGVIAPSGVDFKGGPCCGCVVEKACPDLAVGGGFPFRG